MRLRTLLSLMLAGLLIATAGFIGWLGYSSSYRAIEHLTEQEFALANGVAAHEIVGFLNDPANRLLDELSLRAKRGMLNLDDAQALGFDLAERLRVNKTLAWISYSDSKTGHFVGVWRTPDNSIVINISAPGQGEPREHIVAPDGKESPYQRPRPKDYDPREHDWFKNAVVAKTTVWSKPYTFVDGVQQGITASRAWSTTDNGVPVGVFTVDFFLNDLERLLNNVARKIEGISVIMEPDGKLFYASDNPDAAAATASLSAWVRSHPRFSNINGQTSSNLVPITVGRTSYFAALDRVEKASGLNCIVAGIVRQSVIFGRIDRAVGQMGLFSLAGLVLAVLAGSFIAYRIGEPLRALGNDLAKVGQFYLAPHEAPPSILHEVNQLRDAADRMKSGLRSFIKFVPDDLVRRLLSSGKEATLGGEIRQLTIFFSDIEGFTTHSEKVPPDILVHDLAKYFEILTRRLCEHCGTIDKFIGDGLLCFFNAPEEVRNHQNLACRATLIALAELALLRQDPHTFPFRTRVGLHCGDVLVGNIGTPDRFAYTVLGDVVNVASRLESLNKVYGTQILASANVWKQAGNGLEWRHLDRVSVAGREGSLDIYELMGFTHELSEDRLYSRRLYERALELYFARSFLEALRLFVQVAANSPHDKAAALMMARCERLLSSGLRPDWDGVYVHELK